MKRLNFTAMYLFYKVGRSKKTFLFVGFFFPLTAVIVLLKWKSSFVTYGICRSLKAPSVNGVKLPLCPDHHIVVHFWSLWATISNLLQQPKVLQHGVVVQFQHQRINMWKPLKNHECVIHSNTQPVTSNWKSFSLNGLNQDLNVLLTDGELHGFSPQAFASAVPPLSCNKRLSDNSGQQTWGQL